MGAFRGKIRQHFRKKIKIKIKNGKDTQIPRPDLNRVSLNVPAGEGIHSSSDSTCSACLTTWLSIPSISSAHRSSAAPLSSVLCPHWESVFHWSPTVVCLHWAAPALTPPAERRGHGWSDKRHMELCTALRNSWALHALKSAPPSCDAQRHKLVKCNSLSLQWQSWQIGGQSEQESRY